MAQSLLCKDDPQGIPLLALGSNLFGADRMANVSTGQWGSLAFPEKQQSVWLLEEESDVHYLVVEGTVDWWLFCGRLFPNACKRRE